MDEKDQYKAIAVALLLVIIITVLVSPPEVLLQRGVMVDTTSSYTSNDKIWVKTQMELGSNEVIETLPFSISGWKGYNVKINEGTIKALNPDLFLQRAYSNPDASNQVWLLIIRADNRSAFHDPKVCYKGAGWSAVNETQVEITLNASSWAASGSYAGEKDATILVNELLLENDGRYKLIKYFYLKELMFASSPGMITIVRAETVVDDLDDAKQEINDFYSEILPYLFVPVSGGGDPLAVIFIDDHGVVGAVLLLIVFLVPLVYLGWLLLKKG